MLALILWPILSVVVAAYAARKGRSWFGFFVLSLLLSPLVGFFIAALSSPRRDKVAEWAGMKKCPICAEYVQGEALVCRFCGNKFSVVSPSEYVPTRNGIHNLVGFFIVGTIAVGALVLAAVLGALTK